MGIDVGDVADVGVVCTDDGTAVVVVVGGVAVGGVAVGGVVVAAVVGDMLQQPYTFVGVVIYIASVVVAYAFVAFVACVAAWHSLTSVRVPTLLYY